MQDYRFGLRYIHVAIALFNFRVSQPNAVTVESVLALPSIPQRELSMRIDDQLFISLLNSSSVPNKARLLSTSAPHAGSWQSVVPSPGLGLHLEPNECQMIIKWWLGLDTSGWSTCPFCPHAALDPLGHHAIACRHGGDVVVITCCVTCLQISSGEPTCLWQ